MFVCIIRGRVIESRRLGTDRGPIVRLAVVARAASRRVTPRRFMLGGARAFARSPARVVALTASIAACATVTAPRGSMTAARATYSDKHTRVSASFDDVKDIRLRQLPKRDDEESFAASGLWREKPCVIVVMRRPG